MYEVSKTVHKVQSAGHMQPAVGCRVARSTKEN